MSKYFKMVDGMTSWENYFQNEHIEKVAAQVEERVKPKPKPFTSQLKQRPQSKRSRPQTGHYQSQSLGSFRRLMMLSKEGFDERSKEIIQL